ncbi:SPOR domain-containing protein [Azospirillum soli]|uniref:SPOR domain-containing protein n=1 Tax=Azospirillum soli TaxID=1304799 RepID=UPI001AE6B677|nr:hypothetical protein [Azospirillum soli]
MAVPRGSLPIVLGGTLLFGTLTFLLGLVVGVNMNAPVPAAAVAEVASAQEAPPPAAQPVPAQGGASGGDAPPTTPAPAETPAKTGAAEPAAEAPAIVPVKVKGFGFGAPPSSEPASVLRGKLLRQAGAPPPPADAKDTPPKDAPPKDAPKDPPGPPLVYSVAVGRFLVEANAGRLYAEAAAKGYQPMIVVPDPPDPAGWMTVTLGPQVDAATAGRLAEDAAARGFETWLVSWLAP